ncbi:hypothetical protein CC117_26540 [Parafrankia colletiae]|uniref:Transcription regulator PadR N-terminal domain-containing protein n=1 Tax=Parafrankia colletiae TaxID=573497 RepID=A0A1S1Q8S0_9ACTN|nr:PadR family transcriptional regulator [Parafrankia colletiae]MCK9902641.1 PadR family transcriptional regulator [Frankia sp. Cpl3]OHV31248.1 hypothetical protein CC117_26540 [Parafrankia colletiae]
MHLDFVILGMLAMRRLSGYDLRRGMEGPLRFIGYGVQLPQIYRRLGRLTDQGLVEFEVDPRDGRPTAKVYTLTEAGRQHLVAWARSPYEPSTRPMDPDFILRFVFGGQIDRQIAVDVVRTELEYRLANVSPDGRMQQPPGDLEPQIPDVDPAFAREIYLLAHEWGYTSVRAYVTWLQLTLIRLEESGRADGSPRRPAPNSPPTDCDHPA